MIEPRGPTGAGHACKVVSRRQGRVAKASEIVREAYGNYWILPGYSSIIHAF